MKIKYLLCLLLLCLFCNFQVYSQDTELLKTQDVSKIMQQIFTQHVDKKEISPAILKNSFKIYIDQFDPDRIYLLEEEVKPYLQLSDNDIATLMAQYRKNDFSAYTKLNILIQKGIERSRTYREELEKNYRNEIFQGAKVPSGSMENEWLDPDLKRLFAKSPSELKARIRDHLSVFIVAEKRRFGEQKVLNNEPQMLGLFERHMHQMEDSYMAVDESGKLLPKNQQENQFVIHVLKSLANSLDAHTTFYNPSEAYDMKVRLEKEFEGIGIGLEQAPEGIMVTRIIPGGPAAKSGLIKENDIITSIDGKNLSGLELKEIMEMLHGRSGSTVALIIKRKPDETSNWKQYNVTLKREAIVINDDRVDTNYESFGNGIIGMVTLHSFYQGEDSVSSVSDLREAILKLDKIGNLRGLVLDLRENSGGFLTQAVKVAGLFISNGVIVISKYFNGEEHVYRDVDGHPVFHGPLVILTSKATASAAEIVAQALQDYGVAIIVGDEHTYGKGTIQSQTVTENEGTSYFKVTVGKYYTVSGKTPQIQGVKADIVVPSQYSKEHIGEEYLDYPIQADTIKADYKDDLRDIDPNVKAWYLRYYIPTLQSKIETWDHMIPTLKKNSEYRLKHNKNFQVFLKVMNGEKIDEPPVQSEEDLANSSTDHKNFGKEDLQMQEAVNIVKDMIYLQAHQLQENQTAPQNNVQSSQVHAAN